MIDNKKNTYAYYITAGLVLIHLFYLIIQRPYESGLNNFSIVFNQFAILFSLFWTIGSLVNISFLSTFYIYAFIGILYTVNFLGLIRSIVSLKELYFNKPRSAKSNKNVKNASETDIIF